MQYWIDAACVGESGFKVNINGVTCLQVKSMGRGNRQVQLTDDRGFPRTRGSARERYKPKKNKRIKDFSTGDLVRVTFKKGNRLIKHITTISIRSTGIFSFKYNGKTIDLNYKRFKIIQYNNGYA